MADPRTLSPGRALRPEVRMNKEQEEAVMKRLTAEELKELRSLVEVASFRIDHYDADDVRAEQALVDNRHALLAMASRLAEVESALEFLDVYCRVDLVGQARHLPANTQNALALARELGWTSPTEKPNDGGRDG